MCQLKHLSLTAVLTALIGVAAPNSSRAQQPATSQAHYAAAGVTRSSNARVRARSADSYSAHDEIAAVRRQPKGLLDGIVLSRAEKKAVYGIIRRNARTLTTLEERDRFAVGQPALHVQLTHEVAAVRDRERAELRAVLDQGQRLRFDRNVVRLDERQR